MPVPMDSNSWISSPETVEYFLKMQFGSHPWILMSRIIVTSTPNVLFLAPLFKFALCLIHHWWLPTDTLAIKTLAPGTGIWLFFFLILSRDRHSWKSPALEPCMPHYQMFYPGPPRDIHCLIWLPSSLILQAPSILWERLPWLGQKSPLSHSYFVCNCTSVQESCLHKEECVVGSGRWVTGRPSLNGWFGEGSEPEWRRQTKTGWRRDHQRGARSGNT